MVIFHNPGCGTSRKVLEAITAAGVTPQVVRYLEAGWTRPQLRRLLDALAMRPRDLLRPAQAGAFAEKDEAAILDAMVSDPSLVERPIVTTAKGAALCRPADRLAAIL